MRLTFGLILVLLFALPLASRAQDVPGNVFLAVPTYTLGSGVDLCLIPSYGFVNVYATAPLEPVKSVRFQIVWPEGVDHDQGIIAPPGAVDVSQPGDDIWEIQFAECLDSHGGTLALLYYYNVDFHDSLGGWMCAYGDEVPKPVWTLCSGETIEGDLIDMGPGWTPEWRPGCSPYGYWANVYCRYGGAVSTQRESWGTLKSYY